MRKFFRAESVCFLAIWLLLILFGRINLFRDPGTFWHIAVGRQILATQQFPTVDTFSFTFYGHPWLASQWLMECLMALVYDHLGFDGLLLLTAGVLAGFFAWIFSRLLRSGLQVPLASLVLVLALAASSHHFHVRPHVLSIILLGLTFAWLCDFEAGRKRLWTLFWLWPLYIIWTNSHGAVLGGLGTMALTIGGWSLARLFRQDSPIKGLGDFVTLGILLLGCILTVFLNPYGAELPRTWLELVNSPAVPLVIQEHASPFQTPWNNLPIFAFGLVFAACLAGVLPRRPRVTWLIPLVWLVLACSRVRNAPLFAVTAALALPEFFAQVGWARWLGDRGSVIFRRPDRAQPRSPLDRKSFLVPGVVVLLTAILSAGSMHFSGHGLTSFNPRHWPIDLLPDLKRHAATQPPGAPIMNDMLFGGFLIFHTPGLKVFIDDRCELYGDEFLLSYGRDDRNFIAQWAGQSGARAALAAPGSVLDDYFKQEPGWRLVKRTAAAAFYLRTGA